MKNICIGILAHVDAGKTTLSEALLYRAGAIRRLGRVDHQDAFLDTDAMERQRGITIFSKQAVLELSSVRVHFMNSVGDSSTTPKVLGWERLACHFRYRSSAGRGRRHR